VVVAMLRGHRTEQKAQRLRAGNQWIGSGLVFTTELGAPVDPRNLVRVIEAAAKTAGIEAVGIHTLRHSAAVRWLERGVRIKAVAHLLGHSSIAITGDVYGHASDDTARTAVRWLERRSRPVIVGAAILVGVCVSVLFPKMVLSAVRSTTDRSSSEHVFRGRADRI